ncbi:MAG: ribonuclease H-like domain-containing protein [Candidatus Peribacteraceae bacterium]|nr:ribonuclease H-like domain-containing protein [Candidatus Peribacteraceae bacterium]
MNKVDFCVFDISYVVEDNLPIVKIWGKTKAGKSVLAIDRDFYPYFYAEADENMSTADVEALKMRLRELKEFGEKIKTIENVNKKYLGKEKVFLKVVVTNPRDLPSIKDTIKEWKGIRRTYEYDIMFYRRYIIDKGIIPMKWISVEGEKEKDSTADIVIDVKSIIPMKGIYPKFKTMAIDIETVDEEIIMISLVSKGFRKVLTHSWDEKAMNYVEILENEAEMLKRFIELIRERNPDIIVTYNGDMFDFVKINERCFHYKIDLNIGRGGEKLEFRKRTRRMAARIIGRTHIDIYNFVYSIIGSSLQSETFTLDMVSKELLGAGKKPLDWKKLSKMWKEKKGLNKISRYCEWDSQLTLKLLDLMINQIFELCKVSGQIVFDVSRMSYSQLVEWLLIRKAYEKNEIVLNRPTYIEMTRRREASPYLGGYVLEPEPGIHKNIALFDFASLYPSTIITHNISPETLDSKSNGKNENRVPDSDHFFSIEKTGFIPSIMEELVKKRIEIKQQMQKLAVGSPKYKDLYSRQYALKLLTNASYGYYAYSGSRWYSRICAMAIASFGRRYIKNVIDTAKKNNFKVIYGDTDSLFISECSKQKAQVFLKEVNENLPGTMELEFEGMYKSGIFVPTKTGTAAKKRYALLDNKDHITIRGFEVVRRDWCKIAKDTQEQVLSAILKDKDKDKAIAIVMEMIDKVKGEKIKKEDLVLYTQLTKPINEYEQIGPHVAAAKKSIEYGQTVKEGQIIGYIISKGTGSISSRAEPYDYAEDYDPEYYINNQILPAAMRILHALGFTEEDVLSEPPGQKSLDTFMKKSLKKRLRESFEKFRSD